MLLFLFHPLKSFSVLWVLSFFPVHLFSQPLCKSCSTLLSFFSLFVSSSMFRIFFFHPSVHLMVSSYLTTKHHTSLCNLPTPQVLHPFSLFPLLSFHPLGVYVPFSPFFCVPSLFFFHPWVVFSHPLGTLFPFKRLVSTFICFIAFFSFTLFSFHPPGVSHISRFTPTHIPHHSLTHQHLPHCHKQARDPPQPSRPLISQTPCDTSPR